MKDFIPFALQGVFMAVDELFFHRHRTLRCWERIGHPLDTFFFAVCLAWTLLKQTTPHNLEIYAGLAFWSCLFVTKDEWQHRELCSGAENWLHAVLFILHPVLLIWTGWLWWQHIESFVIVIKGALGLTVLFGIYQAIYWNVWRNDRQ